MRFVPVVLVLASGCVRDLPDSPLGDDARLLFRDFDDNPDALPAIIGRMSNDIEDQDLQVGKSKRLSDLPELTSDFFGGAAVPDGLDPADTMRAAMVAESAYSVDDNLRAQVQENFTCANASAVTCHERLPATVDDDPVCFEDGTCDVYRTTNTIRIETTLDFWIQAPVDFRRVTLADGRKAALSRTWLEDDFPNDNEKKRWAQRFAVDLFIEHPDDAAKTLRYYASWNGPDVDGIPAIFLKPALRNGIDDGFTNPDAWLDDETCDVVLSECLADSPF